MEGVDVFSDGGDGVSDEGCLEGWAKGALVACL